MLSVTKWGWPSFLGKINSTGRILCATTTKPNLTTNSSILSILITASIRTWKHWNYLPLMTQDQQFHFSLWKTDERKTLITASCTKKASLTFHSLILISSKARNSGKADFQRSPRQNCKQLLNKIWATIQDIDFTSKIKI